MTGTCRGEGAAQGPLGVEELQAKLLSKRCPFSHRGLYSAQWSPGRWVCSPPGLGSACTPNPTGSCAPQGPKEVNSAGRLKERPQPHAGRSQPRLRAQAQEEAREGETRIQERIRGARVGAPRPAGPKQTGASLTGTGLSGLPVSWDSPEDPPPAPNSNGKKVCQLQAPLQNRPIILSSVPVYRWGGCRFFPGEPPGGLKFSPRL